MIFCTVLQLCFKLDKMEEFYISSLLYLTFICHSIHLISHWQTSPCFDFHLAFNFIIFCFRFTLKQDFGEHVMSRHLRSTWKTMTLCDSEEKGVYFQTSRQMRACSLYVVHRFIKQEGWGQVCVGNGRCGAENHRSWESAIPTGLGQMLCLCDSHRLSLHDSNPLLYLLPTSAENCCSILLSCEGLLRRQFLTWYL